MVSQDDSFRKVGMHLFHQLTQGTDLLGRTGVSLLPCRVQPTFVTDADAVAVMVHHMCPDLIEAATCFNRTVSAYHEMVADTPVSLLTVPEVDVLGGAPLPRSDSRAMKNNHRNSSHNRCYLQLVTPRAARIAASRLIMV